MAKKKKNRSKTGKAFVSKMKKKAKTFTWKK